MNQTSRLTKAEDYRYIICLITFSCYILVFFHRLSPAVIALDMQDAFGVSGTLLGVLGSAYFYPYAIMQLPIGLLADSWGPRKTIFIFFLLAASGSVLMGLAPNLGIAILGRVLVGFGVSSVFVCNFKLLAEWFNPRQFVTMGGIFMAMGGIGALSSSAPLAWVSNLIGWRMTFVAVGMTTLVMAVLVYAFVRNRPTEMGLPPLAPIHAGPTQRWADLLGGIKQVATAGRFWPNSLWAFFATGISFALVGLWGGPYLMQVYGLNKVAAGQVLSMFAVALMVGSPFLSWMANRLGRKPVLNCSSLLLMVVFGIFYFFPGRLPLPMLYILFFCIGLGGGAPGPVSTTVSKELFPLAIAGTSVGMLNLFPFFGAALFQIISGAALARGGKMQGVYSLVGYQDMFLIYLFGVIISFLSTVFLQETLGRWEESEG